MLRAAQTPSILYFIVWLSFPRNETYNDNILYILYYHIIPVGSSFRIPVGSSSSSSFYYFTPKQGKSRSRNSSHCCPMNKDISWKLGIPFLLASHLVTWPCLVTVRTEEMWSSFQTAICPAKNWGFY